MTASTVRARVLAAAVTACVLGPGCGDSHSRHAATAAASLRLAQRSAQPAGRAVSHTARCAPSTAPSERRITRREWLGGLIITEYYPVPESWSEGAPVSTPGLPGRHRTDWLYSAKGVSMEGDGVDLAGRRVHILDVGSAGWVNAGGKPTVPPRCGVHWSAGAPNWRAGGWRNRAGAVTFPLAAGGWSNGAGRWVGGYGGATFAYGASLPLRYYHSVAVDPSLIPLGSRIFIPAYSRIGGGWFMAQDTGGAIIGRHLDVYRPHRRTLRLRPAAPSPARLCDPSGHLRSPALRPRRWASTWISIGARALGLAV